MPQSAPHYPRVYCERTGHYYDDLTGQVFGSWIVLRPVNPGSPKWVCRCVCGTERWVYGFTLRNGQSKSCGCRPRAPRLKLEEARIAPIIYKGTKFYAVLPTDASTVPLAMFQALSEARAYRDGSLPSGAMLRVSDPGAMGQLREALGLPSPVTEDDAERHAPSPMISSDSQDRPKMA